MIEGGGDVETGRIRPEDLTVSPPPSDDELAAIIAACERIWSDEGSGVVPAPSPRWRYAGRPWIRRAHYGGWR